MKALVSGDATFTGLNLLDALLKQYNFIVEFDPL